MNPQQQPLHQKSYFILKKINPVIRILTVSGILIVSGFGLVFPIFAVFIVRNIEGGTVEVAGIAIAVYWITKSLGQIPAAAIIDAIKGERDDFWAVFIGSIIYSGVPLLYIFVTTPLELYFTQFIYGLAAAFVWPAWNAIFTRHIDRQREGVEWGIYYTLTDFASAVTATIGGLIAYRFGFTPLFILVSITVFIGSMFLLGIYQKMKVGSVLFKK